MVSHAPCITTAYRGFYSTFSGATLSFQVDVSMLVAILQAAANYAAPQYTVSSPQCHPTTAAVNNLHLACCHFMSSAAGLQRWLKLLVMPSFLAVLLQSYTVTANGLSWPFNNGTAHAGRSAD